MALRELKLDDEQREPTLVDATYIKYDLNKHTE